MPASEAISFELERFEWARPDRLEVEGRWHGVRRRLARATLVVEVDGKRRRLKALPDVDAGSAERWVAAFPWEGEMPKLPGAELEVGRGIVVDLPRPRRSKARGAATTPAEPIPATSREKREATPGRNEVDRLIAVLTAARTDAEEAGAQAAAAEAEVSALRDRAEAAEAAGGRAASELEAVLARAEAAEAAGGRAASELEAVQARAEAAETELEAMRARAEAAEADLETEGRRANAAEAELETERERASTAEAELEARRGRSEEVESELTALEARAEAAEAEATALRSSGAEADTEPASAPDLERLRTELQTVERERMELRAQLDATLERLQTAERQARAPARRSAPQATAASTSERTETMPGPRTLAAGGPRFGRPADEDADDTEPRRTRRPAERTARRSGATPEASAAASSGPPLGERISDWVASLTGSRAEAQNGGAETEPARRTPRPTGQRTRAAQAGGTAVRTRQRTDRRRRGADDGPSWPLRVAAVGLLALLMVALVVILLSLL